MKTTVDWLIEQLQAPCRTIPSHIIEEAMKMEEKQNKFFFDCGRQYQLTGEGTFKQVTEEIYEKR